MPLAYRNDLPARAGRSAIHEARVLRLDLLAQRHLEIVLLARGDAFAAIVEAERYAVVVLQDPTRDVRPQQACELPALVRVRIEREHGAGLSRIELFNQLVDAGHAERQILPEGSDKGLGQLGVAGVFKG